MIKKAMLVLMLILLVLSVGCKPNLVDEAQVKKDLMKSGPIRIWTTDNPLLRSMEAPKDTGFNEILRPDDTVTISQRFTKDDSDEIHALIVLKRMRDNILNEQKCRAVIHYRLSDKGWSLYSIEVKSP